MAIIGVFFRVAIIGTLTLIVCRIEMSTICICEQSFLVRQFVMSWFYLMLGNVF